LQKLQNQAQPWGLVFSHMNDKPKDEAIAHSITKPTLILVAQLHNYLGIFVGIVVKLACFWRMFIFAKFSTICV
jgi:hypothetical protein